MQRHINKVKPGDQFVFADKYYVTIVNVSDYREPNIKYAGEIYSLEGKHLNPDDLLFFGDELLNRCKRR
jgi:hypothetical protein